MKRSIITIDEEKCTGCGLCIPGCPEGAIQVIDRKARLVSDLMCDGLGACLGHCPEGAITIEEREAEPYDERKVMEQIVRQGANTVRAHLAHLQEHNQAEYYAQAIAYLKEHDAMPFPKEPRQGAHAAHTGGCPGARSMAFARPQAAADQADAVDAERPSRLTHWPIQMHLISPVAPHFQGADLLLAADCVAYTVGDFHRNWLKGKTLAIACPKLDENQEVYLDKLIALIDAARVNTLTVMIMQVPCCRGLLMLAQRAASSATRKIPIKAVVVSLQGEILHDEWLLG
jgi:NAD-dependent dihydropyrimidine dehydrogenase PreA subunit